MSDEPVCICDHGRENIPCPIHNKPEKSKILDIGQRWAVRCKSLNRIGLYDENTILYNNKSVNSILY
jgi:hypothetical protein